MNIANNIIIMMGGMIMLLRCGIVAGTGTNVIDNCWRGDSRWVENRMRLADCAVGFGSQAKGGKGGEIYTVTRSDDHPENPPPGTLRYGATRNKAMWIVFKSSMSIKLKMPLLVTSHKTIDGRGANVEISDGPCIRLSNATNVIIHGLRIHDCRRSSQGRVVASENLTTMLTSQDGDAISIVDGSSNIWVDHNTLSSCDDGLVDVTLASTDVTVSNNRFSYHDKVMLLGHSDDYSPDKNMRVTVAFNHFGPGLVERMPRVRHGYAHVANNDYEPWGIYAVGGSANPMISSEGNRFAAPNEEYKKQVTWREGAVSGKAAYTSPWLWKSSRDVFINGAYFVPSGRAKTAIAYSPSQFFKVAVGAKVPILTRDAGTLACKPARPCF